MPEAQHTQFLRFLGTGGIAALVNFGSRFVFDEFTSFSVAIVLAFLCGLSTAFVLAKAFVFTTSTLPTAHSAAWFVAVNVVTLALTWGVTMALVRVVFPGIGFAFHPEAVAHAIGIMVPVFTSFVAHKNITFRVEA